MAEEPAKAPLRILVVAVRHMFPSRDDPSAGIFLANLLARLKRRVERVVVVAPVAYVPGCLRVLRRFSRLPVAGRHQTWRGIDAYYPPYWSLSLRRHLWFQSRMLCASAVPVCDALHRRHRFNLVLSSSFGSPAHTAQYVAARFGCPSVAWAIGSDVHTSPSYSEENLRLLRHNVRHNRLVLTVSDALRREMLRLCPAARNVRTFYRGIDLEDFRPRGDRAALRKELGLDPQRTYLLMAGHVGKAKGSDEFYESFRQLAGRTSDLAAVWVGDGPEVVTLKERAGQDRLMSRLRITGRIPRPEVVRFMQAADVLLFTSHAEGLPNVVLESMAAGLPVVATDVGGIREIVRHGETGLVVPPRDVPAMVHAAVQVLEDPDAARRMAHEARNTVLEQFDVDRNAAVLLDVLKYIAGGGDPGGLLPHARTGPGDAAPDTAGSGSG